MTTARSLTLFLSLALLPLFALVASCTSTVPLDDRPCPCAKGWVCCSAGLCAKDLNTCPQPEGNPAGTGGSAPPPAVSVNPNAPAYPADPVVTIPAGLTGGWTGYFENFKFASGSDSVKLTLDQGTLTLVVGAEPAPPPATDPTVGWPPGIDLDITHIGNGFVFGARSIEGFRYTAHDVHWAGQRLTFKVAADEAYQGWCALQTSYYVNDTGYYNCTPGSGGSAGPDLSMCTSEDNQGTKRTPVSCAQAWLCSHCACTADSCGGATVRNMSFDITFDGMTAAGSAVLPEGEHPLHLRTVP